MLHEFPKRMGMGPKNAEIFIEDERVFVRIYNDKTGWYHTWKMNVPPDDMRESLNGAECEVWEVTLGSANAKPGAEPNTPDGQ